MIPRALHVSGTLERLITESWVEPNSIQAKLLPGKRAAGRFHADLTSARVESAGLSALFFEMRTRVVHALDGSGWQTVVARNKWFDAFAGTRLARGGKAACDGGVYFSYSYSTSASLQRAKNLGYRVVLGQIDGGFYEEQLVLQEQAKYPQLQDRFRRAPNEYWTRWRSECEMADRIIINSEWTARCLAASGVALEKIRLVPLFYVPPAIAMEIAAERVVPAAFSTSRPLRVLFLGQVILRKGLGPLIEAMRMLKGRPVEFWFVGAVGLVFPEDIWQLHSFRAFGARPRQDVVKFYRDADVFILPTVSDGFAMTQLEAQAFGLPIIVSKNCGSVVRNGIDGIVLSESNAQSICDALTKIISSPDQLTAMSRNILHGDSDIANYADSLKRAAE